MSPPFLRTPEPSFRSPRDGLFRPLLSTNNLGNPSVLTSLLTYCLYAIIMLLLIPESLLVVTY